MDPSTTRHSAPGREVLLVGHYCHDTIIGTDGSVRLLLGGATAHAAAVLAPLGADFRVVAKVGEDFRYHEAVARPPLVVKNAPTTAFVDDYRGVDRIGTLAASAPPVRPADLGDIPCRVGMACGIAGEIGPDTLARLRELSGIAVADAQAFVRRVDSAGGRVHTAPPEPSLRSEIDRLDWLKLSRSETAALDPSTLKHCRALVTDGQRGSILLQGGRETRVPAFPARELDPTGAGDCYLAGFVWGLLRGWDPERAALFGSFCGALAVAQHGVPRLTRSDLDAFSARMSDGGPCGP
jgi:1D-myo-inositol 3-kinase